MTFRGFHGRSRRTWLGGENRTLRLDADLAPLDPKYAFA